MASNLSTIGFHFSDEGAFRAAMMACAGKATDGVACADGAYGIWRSRTGAEVWFHLGRGEEGKAEIFGLTPFFDGKSAVPLRITGELVGTDDNAYEGALQGWVAPDGSSEGSYPIVFHAVDFAAHRGADWPDVRTVRLSGFAHSIQAFPSDDAYYAARGAPDSENLKLSAHAFIPLGLFSVTQEAAESGDGSSAGPVAAALLTGKVLEHKRFTNEETSRAFVWVLVESLEATFDIVADPAVISGDIVDGGTIETSVVMFGRMLDGGTGSASGAAD